MCGGLRKTGVFRALIDSSFCIQNGPNYFTLSTALPSFWCTLRAVYDHRCLRYGKVR